MFPPERIPLSLPNAEFWYQQSFLSVAESQELMNILINTLPWRSDEIWLFGKKVQQPRLTCWVANEGVSIKYSGIEIRPFLWAEPLSSLLLKINQATGEYFNSVLINYYRHGQDSMGWHADDEKELGPDPKIASLSLGATRKFQLKEKASGQLTNILLENGSLFYMGSGSQIHFKHQLPKQGHLSEARINLTFRKMIA